MAASHQDAAALKGFACLRELRRAAVQEEEPEPFNACLRKLKERCVAADPPHAPHSSRCPHPTPDPHRGQVHGGRRE